MVLTAEGDLPMNDEDVEVSPDGPVRATSVPTICHARMIFAARPRSTIAWTGSSPFLASRGQLLHQQ
jgi:hypothetical protein